MIEKVKIIWLCFNAILALDGYMYKDQDIILVVLLGMLLLLKGLLELLLTTKLELFV